VALFLVATPIGTLSDLSPRAAEVLGSVAAIAAEDTRTTRKLLNAREIPAPQLVALHAHNEARIAERVAQRALEEDIALVSDAGTPAISDPGRAVIDAAHRLGVEVRSVPGPSALAAALAASGFPAAPSSFLGFPPRKGLANWAKATVERPETLVFYESPKRLAKIVAALAGEAPAREACMCREISKKFEEVRRAPLAELAEHLGDRAPLKGECVLVIGPGVAPSSSSAVALEGTSLKDIAAVLGARWGVSKKDAYKALLGLDQDMQG